MIVTTTEFDLESKKIIYVTDNGSNIVKACSLAGVERMGCIAHGVHNLITVDGRAVFKGGFTGSNPPKFWKIFFSIRKFAVNTVGKAHNIQS
jgi:hypothetical protein